MYLQGTEDAIFDGCTWNQVGGNGLILSNYNRRANISGCHFHHIGDSAIISLGTTRFHETHNTSSLSADLLDGTDGNHPEDSFISSNLFREIGIFGKQTSA